MNESQAVILEFIRGDRPWLDLTLAGITISFDEGSCTVESHRVNAVIPEITDVARGFTNTRARSGDLREWASVMLAAPQCIDLSTLESGPTGEALLEALWDASASGDLSDEQWRTIEKIAAA